MAITQAICNSFKQELLEGDHNFDTGGDVFKLALYTSAATLNSATTVYPGDSTGIKSLILVNTFKVAEL
jgi:hypothetical protein